MVRTQIRTSTSFRRLGARRAALTTLEYIGCAVAVAGGIWLGSMYMGVDMREAAHTALEETELLDKVPADWRPAPPADAETPEQTAARLRDELAAIGNQISSLQNGETPVADAVPTTDVDVAARDETLRYWREANDFIAHEANMQKEAQAAFNSSNAAKVFAVKAKASQIAAEAIANIKAGPKTDREAIHFTRQLSAWYENGAQLYERAVRIWEAPTGSKGRAQLNEEWRRAELQHQNEARLISEKGATIRGALSRRYGVEFAGLGETAPKAPSAAQEETPAQTR